jgi:hypothetical protein
MNKDQKQQLMYRIDEILYYLWDPIGVNDSPGARDEYTSYADSVWRMALGGKTESELSDYLTGIVTSRMELEPRKESDDSVAALIMSWKEYFENFN